MDSQIKSSVVDNIVAIFKGVPTREDLVELLEQELVEVTFTKLNGDERKMVCTLRENYLPEAKKGDPLSQTKIRNLEDKTIVVWDVNADSWRSFRYDRVKKVESINTENEELSK